MSQRTRRRVVAAVATGLTAALAGCEFEMPGGGEGEGGEGEGGEGEGGEGEDGE